MSGTLALFVDFETTGINTETDVILEAYFDLRLIDPQNEITMRRLLEHKFYVDSVFDRSAMHPIAEQMHHDNGLWADLEKNAPSKMNISTIDSIMTAAVTAKRDELHGPKIHLAGNGVANFDKRLIERDMPLLNKLLHYRCLDVSILRMAAELSGWTPAPEQEDIFGTIAHRAEDDVNQSITQFRHLSRQLKRLEIFDNKVSAV